ncbi:MAG: leucine-rich repeat domain-containing protein [Treponema sp.]|nr:leucine-rich repeat domain-containing protein [Treponema sp.]
MEYPVPPPPPPPPFTPNLPLTNRSIARKGLFALVLGVIALFFAACPQLTDDDPPPPPPVDGPDRVSRFDLTPFGIAPVAGEGCATGLSTAQYTGTIAWKTANGEHSGNFAAETVYIAEVSLSVKSGYTFTGVAEDSFTYSGAEGVTNPAGQGSGLTVTITFPKTGAREKITITSTEGLAVLLAGQSGGNSADDPVEAAAALELSEDNWRALLTGIDGGGKYVSLDLAACTRSDNNILGGLRSSGNFAPMPSISTGKRYIVNLTLPVQASGIVPGASGTPTFKNFRALKTVSGEGVRTIGEYAFYSDYSNSLALTSVSLPAAETIGDQAFYDCDALASVSLPAVKSIGGYAFYDCDALTSVSLPAVKTIGNQAFWHCSALASVSLPAAESIGNQAFYDCGALASVTMPASLSREAFNSAYFGGKIVWTLVGSGDWSTFENGALLVYGGDTLVYGYGASGGITIPASITSIGDSAFSGCNALTSVILPAAETIGVRAFYRCGALASASLPAVKSIGEYAFYGCYALASVSLPAAETIGIQAFAYCYALASVSLPAAKTIGDSAFSGCNALTSVILGATPPILGTKILYDVNGSITVGIPSGSETAYGVSGYNNGDSAANNWGNAFRGNGSSGYGTVNTRVSLFFETY